MDCGPVCLRIICEYYGKLISVKCLRKLCKTSQTGSSLQSIREAAKKIGFKARGVRLSYEHLVEYTPLPCIVHWKKYHFIVVYRVSQDKIYVSDPAYGLLTYTKDDFLNNWAIASDEGIALILRKTIKFDQDIFEQNIMRYSYREMLFCSILKFLKKLPVCRFR
jgi:ATP-binding cassette subfamily B protein